MLRSRRRITCVIVIAMLGMVGCGSNKKEMDIRTADFIEQVNVERALGFVNHLSDTIGSRPIGTDSEYEAASYIASEFEKLGLEVEISQFECRKIFDKDYSWNVEAIRRPNGEDESDTDKVVYVTAHFDSVNAGPGANDNASGVGAILEIATAMNDLDIDREVRFVAFGGEEAGLLGSKAYL